MKSVVHGSLHSLTFNSPIIFKRTNYWSFVWIRRWFVVDSGLKTNKNRLKCLTVISKSFMPVLRCLFCTEKVRYTEKVIVLVGNQAEYIYIDIYIYILKILIIWNNNNIYNTLGWNWQIFVHLVWWYRVNLSDATT